MNGIEAAAQVGTGLSVLGGATICAFAGPLGIVVGLSLGAGGIAGTEFAKNRIVDNSGAMKLARRICDEWLLDFKDLIPRPILDVVPLLERLQDHPSAGKKEAGGRTLLDELRPHMYGWTPMRAAMSKTLAVFREHPDIEQRALVMISDGNSTDGDPLPLADELKQENVTIAGVFLTNDNTISRRRLHDQPPRDWFNRG